MQTLSTQFVGTSPLWHALRRSLHNQEDVRSFGEAWDWSSAVPLREMLPGRTGLCRVLHVAASKITSIVHTSTYRVNEARHAEWITDDEEFWTDITSLPSFAEFVHHESVY